MKILLKISLLFVFSSYLLAHSLLLSVYDNQDGTISIEGYFNTGESAAGAFIRLKAIETNEILFEQRLPDSSELTVKIPEIEYQIILDGGPGHTVIEKGIAPEGGFKKVTAAPATKKSEKQKDRSGKMSMQLSSSPAVNISIIVGFVLLFATIMVGILNNNKLLRELKSR